MGDIFLRSELGFSSQGRLSTKVLIGFATILGAPVTPTSHFASPPLPLPLPYHHHHHHHPSTHRRRPPTPPLTPPTPPTPFPPRRRRHHHRIFP
ncbi:hypothetical protein M0802_005504 [Mischocyttarus mexicanus]|nr:hypothetical protein M0802_005504 [Mischocyttarus mexicanus]